jgi:hypothetical protein
MRGRRARQGLAGREAFLGAQASSPAAALEGRKKGPYAGPAARATSSTFAVI